MKDNYIIVLFKNKKKKKIIKRFCTEIKSKEFFSKLKKENNMIFFEKKIENATESEYSLGLLTNQSKSQKTIHYTDELGRNVLVNLDNANYVFLDITYYKIEEKIFDWQDQKKITINELKEKYFKNLELKNIFTLNNKLCVQIDEDVFVFSLKNSEESKRLLYVLEENFISEGRGDSLFIRDVSTAQRKWIYNILESKGFDKRKLYRLKTTFSKR
jgi:hypothetical protein